MIEHGRFEVAARDVADTAILVGRNVVGFVNFSSRWRLKTVMAGIAGTQDLYVINGEYGRPYCWAMAIFADVGRQNMRRILTGRLCAVVAADAVTKDVDVIEIGGYPGARNVTVVASIVARDVCQIFASCGHAVVAADTIAEDVAVVEDCRGPRRGVVAVVTLVV